MTPTSRAAGFFGYTALSVVCCVGAFAIHKWCPSLILCACAAWASWIAADFVLKK